MRTPERWYRPEGMRNANYTFILLTEYHSVMQRYE